MRRLHAREKLPELITAATLALGDQALFSMKAGGDDGIASAGGRF